MGWQGDEGGGSPPKNVLEFFNAPMDRDEKEKFKALYRTLGAISSAVIKL